MSIVALGMNILLAILLLCALGFGVRLDRKLRGVRDGQIAFAKAVADLDAAAMKAQAGLADLRAATDEATDHLGGRIARAREAADRLEKLLGRVEAMPSPVSPAVREGPEGGLAALLASVSEAAESIASPMRPRSERPPVERPVRAVRAAPRPSIDDDLFEDAARDGSDRS